MRFNRSRLEAGGNSNNFAQNDLQEIISDVAELYEPVAEENNIELVTIKGETLLIDVDRQLLGQAVANLVDNAIKYGGAQAGDEDINTNQGRIVLEAGVSLRDDQHGEAQTFFISVSDRGPGIPVHEVENAMKRFGRLEKSRSKPGTGLGLSLVAAVAKLHGGELRLEHNYPGLTGRILIPFRPIDGSNNH